MTVKVAAWNEPLICKRSALPYVFWDEAPDMQDWVFRFILTIQLSQDPKRNHSELTDDMIAVLVASAPIVIINDIPDYSDARSDAFDESHTLRRSIWANYQDELKFAEVAKKEYAKFLAREKEQLQ
jgi:hypothetical protein